MFGFLRDSFFKTAENVKLQISTIWDGLLATFTYTIFILAQITSKYPQYIRLFNDEDMRLSAQKRESMDLIRLSSPPNISIFF